MNISWAFFRQARKTSVRNLWAAFRHDLFYAALSEFNSRHIEVRGDASSGCGWGIDPSQLRDTSIVISAGVGRDISFELSLVDEFKCRIILLDPSETGIATMSDAKNQRPNIIFLPLALSSNDEPIYLAPPLDAREGSWRLVKQQEATLVFPAISLQTLIQKYEIPRVDLVKMDIEGSEYGVVESLLDQSLPIRQLCVEFHNQVLPGYTRRQTINSLFSLWRAGYRVIDKDGSNHTLINKHR